MAGLKLKESTTKKRVKRVTEFDPDAVSERVEELVLLGRMDLVKALMRKAKTHYRNLGYQAGRNSDMTANACDICRNISNDLKEI